MAGPQGKANGPAAPPPPEAHRARPRSWAFGLEPGRHLAFLGNQDFTLWKFRGPWMKTLLDHGCRVTVLTPPGPFVPRLRDLGLEVREFPLDRLGTFLPAEWQTLRELSDLLGRLQPDLLHVFMAKPVIYGCLAASRSPRTRVVATITGLGSIFVHERFRHLQLLLKSLYRLSLRRAARVVFQNRDDRDFFLQHRIIPARKATLIRGNGIVPPPVSPVVLRRPDAPVTVLMTARLIESKGVREFCRAAGLLRQRLNGRPARFVLVGTPDLGSPDALSEAELAELADTNGVVRLGHQDDLPRLLAGADIFCLPSYREGLSVACLEAMAQGLPVVTSDAPGCRESVESGVSGWLVPVGDPPALADALEDLIRHESRRRQMGEAGYRRCLGEFSSTRIFPQLAALYREVLGGLPTDSAVLTPQVISHRALVTRWATDGRQELRALGEAIPG